MARVLVRQYITGSDDVVSVSGDVFCVACAKPTTTRRLFISCMNCLPTALSAAPVSCRFLPPQRFGIFDA